MLTGVCAPNSPITDDDIEIMRLSGAQSVKLMSTEGTQHSPQDIFRIRAVVPDMQFMVRLKDSLWSRFKAGPDGKVIRNAVGDAVTEQYYPSAESLATNYLNTIRMWYRFGVRWFQVDCEPNLLWRRDPFGPMQFCWFMRRGISQLRQALKAEMMDDVKLISPPFSFSPALFHLGPPNPTDFTLDDWKAAFVNTDRGAQIPFFRIFDAVGAHPYFQSEHQMLDPTYGANFSTLHDWSQGMDIVVTEWACSMTDAFPQPKQADIEAEMVRLYPKWLYNVRLNHPYVLAPYLFIVGGTKEWGGFKVTTPVAQAIGKTLKSSRHSTIPNNEWRAE